MVVLYGLVFGALRVMFRVVYDRPFWRSLGWTPVRLPVMMVMLAGMATAVLVALASKLIHTPTGDSPMTQLLETRADLLVMGALAVTLAPLCEELAFRGFLQPLLVRSLGAAPGILLAAIPFGLHALSRVRQFVASCGDPGTGRRGFRMHAPGHRFHQGRRHHARGLQFAVFSSRS